MDTLRKLESIHSKMRSCRACSKMCSAPVHGPALETEVMLIGQAPGAHESELGRPFAYTAGKTLFGWLNSATQLSEVELREKIYFAAVARCFPGQHISGSGHREPDAEEIKNCRPFLESEILALKPKIILAVGKVAIAEILGPIIFPKGTPLTEVVGKKLKITYHGHTVNVICLPHPSGVSRWPKTEPGKTKLKQALVLLQTALLNYL